MSLDQLKPLLKKTQSSLSLEEFQSIVNVVFHNHEAAHYDSIHNDMKNSLQEQVDLLIEDYSKTENIDNKNFKLLDIGCGTGMSTQLLLNSKIGGNITEISLLDTSPKMLEIAKEKATKWNIKYNLINSDVSIIKERFDIIIVCSVLHHIPDLEIFLNKIESILNEGGIFIHLQDPNGDSLTNAEYRKRLELINYETKKLQSFSIKNIIPKKLKNIINRNLGRKTYIDLINDELIKLKAIKKRMSADELWSVTDIHVETKNSFEDKGISFQFLHNKLSNFKNVSHRSYGFYGLLKSDLPLSYIESEDSFIEKNDLTGRNLACVWVKKCY